MSKTIVSIISEQTIPNYLLIREMACDGDSLLMITSEKVQERIGWMVNALKTFTKIHFLVRVHTIDEENWEDMIDGTRALLNTSEVYHVNLTGGTKYMSLAMYHVFSEFNSHFYYIPYPKNCFFTLSEIASRESLTSITTRISIDEYLANYNIIVKKSSCLFDTLEVAGRMMRFFTGPNGFNQYDYEIIDKLRAYRDRAVVIDLVETKTDEVKRPQIANLRRFLEKINFPLKDERSLTSKETCFLTGGWFEEYCFFYIKNQLDPQDLAIGVKTVRTQQTEQNELDVVFVYGNKLFVIECKTGISGKRFFHETVYKATALKESLLGLSGHSFLLSLNRDKDETLKKMADNMGISYYDRLFFTQPEAFRSIVEEIRQRAQD